ncbi:uroporphyrinogen-III synthase [Methylocystis iwaonis]|uniref:Uroporphyrinogen III methyltransferase n=1 Tax=Methylocystis iwaonis TaxID=2885079 RepID=A0ABM8E955_9HYPH|nr:uroporphyrinogen-III synthase [Methylocystis iwaonis]BDV34490.1 uroporphyrinogen III methyltransferase [Methylocystis iwaonis]
MLEVGATGARVPPGAYDAVLASSAKGIDCAGTDAEPYKALPLHAVGAKTAKTALERGWRPDIVAGKAEAILPLLLARYPAPAHFLYLAGRDRQPALEAGLRCAGHAVTAVDVYEARAAEALSDEARAALAAGEIDIILHYSRRSAEIFLRLASAAGLAAQLRRMAHVALSQDVAAPLKAAGLSVSCVEAPDEAHLLKAAAAIL